MTSCSRRHFLQASAVLAAAAALPSALITRSTQAVEWTKLKAKQQRKHVFITGSTSGIGLVAAQQLIAQGHRVVAHARNEQRRDDVKESLAGAEAIVIGDLSRGEEVRSLAEQVNQLGSFDGIIQNAGIMRTQGKQPLAGGIPRLTMVNTLAPYMLTALIHRPQHMVFISSSMHRGADINIDDMRWQQRSWRTYAAYSCSKFYDTLLAYALARYWPEVYSNAVNPGWVPTKIGGPNAPDDLQAGAYTQSWLATADDDAAKVSGKYFFHMQPEAADPRLNDEQLQDQFLSQCAKLTGLALPDIPATTSSRTPS